MIYDKFMIKQPKFEIGQLVYHCTKESPEGVVINARYDLLTGLWSYEVVFSPEVPTLSYHEHEISLTKRF